MFNTVVRAWPNSRCIGETRRFYPDGAGVEMESCRALLEAASDHGEKHDMTDGSGLHKLRNWCSERA